MEKIKLYRYFRDEDKVTVSNKEPDCQYDTLTRLVAGEKKILVEKNTGNKTFCADIENDEVDNYYEEDFDEEAFIRQMRAQI